MAGIWYRRGTVSLTNGSAVVDGAGVTWNDPAGGVQVGNIFFGPDGEAYEVAYVLSATQLQLASNYGGPTATAQPYAIVTPIVGSIPALSTKVAAVLAFVEGQYDSLDAWAHGGEDETVTITSPISGETVTVPTLAKMGKDYEAVGDALPAAIRAEAAATAATAKAGEASTSAATATTKASEASADADAANTAKNAAVAAADTAATKAVESATSAASAKTDADRAEQAAQVVVGAIIDAGSYDAGSGVLPAPISVGGSVRSCMWKVIGAGAAGGIELGVGDSLVYTTSDSSYYKIDNTESVTSVNGKKGVVSITASDVGADPSGTSSAAITQHEAKAGAHSIAGVDGLQAALDGKEASGAAAAAVAAHKSGADQHSISGVTGLQAALDSKEASGTASVLVTPLEARVTALEARKFTTLIPATYPSGAPHDTHETVDAALPANIAANTRYVLTNPFGVDTRVHVTVELYLNGKWADPGHDGNTGTGTVSGGTVGHYVQGEGIIIQTGSANIATQSALLGGGHGITSTTGITSAPCRVAVRKWEE